MEKIVLTDIQWKALTQIWRGQNDFVRSQTVISQLTEMGLISKGRITKWMVLQYQV